MVGSVRGTTAAPLAGTGFTVRRTATSAGRYLISIPLASSPRALVMNLTSAGAGIIVRIVSYGTNSTDHLFDVETRLATGGIVDGDFNFIVVEVR